MSAPNYWTSLRHHKISRRTMLGASAKAGVGAAGLALVGCGGDDDDDGGAGDAAAAEAAAAAGDSSAAAAAAERAAAAAEAAAAAAAAAGDAGAAAVAEAAAAAATAAAEAAREAGADQAQAAADAAAAAAAAAEDAAQAAREAADAATMADEEDAAPMVSRYDTEAPLRIGYASWPASLDHNTDQGGAAVTNGLHFDPIFAMDKGRQFIASGGYADWEFVEQNTAALLTLQPGVTFHNGEPLDAERLKWFYERNLGIAEYNPDYVSGIRARIAFIDDLQVVDDLTLRVGMDPPSVNMSEQLGGANTAVTPRDYIVDNGDEFFARNPVGTGPYTFVSFSPDQEMVSERWDDWFFQPNPSDTGPHDKYGNWAKTVTARYFPEESTRIAALEAGEIDVADRLGPDGAALFADSDDHHVLTISGLRVMGLELPLNASVDPITGGPNPWRDKRVREAANYAIDRKAIIDNLLTGLELPAVSPFPSGYPLPLGPSGLRGYDPDKARALLEEAGQVGFQFRLHIATGIWGEERWVPSIQQMLNDVGFDVETDYIDLGGALADVRDHTVPWPFLMSQNGATELGSPAGAGFAWTLIGAIDNPYTHTNADDDFIPGFLDFQALIDQGNQEFDPQKRDDIYWDAAVIHYEGAYNIPLFNLSHEHGARKDITYQGWLNADPSLNPRYLAVNT